MGRKGVKNKGPNAASRSQPQISMTLREESTGKKQGNVNARTMSRLDYLKDLAQWASFEAAIPSLGALYGERLASSYETLGIPPDPSLFFCERCESTLEPGENCMVRIETNKSKTRRKRNKKKIPTQNNVVYTCHYCSHRNLLRGTPKGYMKELYRNFDRAKSPEVESIHVESNKVKERDSLPVAADVEGPSTISLGTPVQNMGSSLLESMGKKSRSRMKKVPQTENSSADANADNSISGSNKKRKRKSWTSLKDIAESSMDINNSAISFLKNV